ncbi:hypothetical protein PP940_gp131 [Rhizobium phage RL2RES]|uniref:Uncharacterized protein n=1 Tax=Rhizobium phage RL2RES TaxID=103371 RepID=A0A6B9J1W7_9CAUD|nr:hypothetical protein PP940_gp131 [Rhizobium phage RL2RES]QGZ14210.1 hypothetical protein RL2RES_131 [Rhizobium phage RL2RES]
MHFRPLIDKYTEQLYGEDNVFVIVRNENNDYMSSLTPIKTKKGAAHCATFYKKRDHVPLYRLNVKWKFGPTDVVHRYRRKKTLESSQNPTKQVPDYRQEGYEFWGYELDKDHVYDMKSKQKHSHRSLEIIDNEDRAC